MVRIRLALLALPLLFACSQDPGSAAPSGPPYVAATFYPVAEFARELLGDQLEVRMPLPPGEDPVHWQPTRDALETFRGAQLVISNGAGFENWLNHASLPDSRHLRTADGFRDRWIEQETVTHSHGPGEHTHQGFDGHTWLDPLLAREQARAIAEALRQERPGWPQLSGTLAEREAALLEQFDALDQRFQDLTPRLANVALFASHPAYDYLARRYGWDLTTLEPSDLPAESARPMLMLWEGEVWSDAPERAVQVTFPTAESPDAESTGLGYFGIQAQGLSALESALTGLGL